jgi:NAD(P)-dependent dehydrogenase (short-subunit alcohol dehydrogenase family)
MSEPRAVLVTGGSRGIGRAICLELARQNCHVAVNYVRRKDAADEVVQIIKREGGNAVAVGGNVASAEDRGYLLKATQEAFGRLDVLVNNAGISSLGRKDLLEATEESWDQVLATNLKGPFFLSQAAANAMIDLIRRRTIPEGKIINISSISAYAASVNRGDYCVAKAGVSMMTRLFAVRLAAEKIQVCEICPGVIQSDMTAPVKEKYDGLIAAGLWPIRRWGQPEDVARAVAAVVGDYFPFSTGDRINVDGGFHLRQL